MGSAPHAWQWLSPSTFENRHGQSWIRYRVLDPLQGTEISIWDICTFISIEAVESYFGWLEDFFPPYQNTVNVKYKCWRLV